MPNCPRCEAPLTEKEIRSLWGTLNNSKRKTKGGNPNGQSRFALWVNVQSNGGSYWEIYAKGPVDRLKLEIVKRGWTDTHTAILPIGERPPAI